MRQIKAIKEMRGGVVLYAAQANPQITAEMTEKGRLPTEISGLRERRHHLQSSELQTVKPSWYHPGSSLPKHHALHHIQQPAEHHPESSDHR